MPKVGKSSIEERINRLEGQIRAVKEMYAKKTPLANIITQIKAIDSALESIKIELIKEEMSSKIQEQLNTIGKLIK